MMHITTPRPAWHNDPAALLRNRLSELRISSEKHWEPAEFANIPRELGGGCVERVGRRAYIIYRMDQRPIEIRDMDVGQATRALHIANTTRKVVQTVCMMARLRQSAYAEIA